MTFRLVWRMFYQCRNVENHSSVRARKPPLESATIRGYSTRYNILASTGDQCHRRQASSKEDSFGPLSSLRPLRPTALHPALRVRDCALAHHNAPIYENAPNLLSRLGISACIQGFPNLDHSIARFGHVSSWKCGI